ncbi:MAG: hypothetical protein HYU39_06580 [Thaumarchaeota archaeon]|nr:hypothetical protein [Nitrososphaerota archaeon]
MAITQPFGTVPEFLFFADKRLASGEKPPVVVFPVFLNAAPEELPSIASGRNVSAKVTMVTEDLFRLRIGLRKRVSDGYLVNHEHHWVAYLEPEERRTGVSEVSARWMRNMFPIVTPTSVTSQQLIELVESLKIVERSNITVLDYVTRSRKGETTKRWPKNLDFSKEAIQTKARKDDALVDAIRILFVSPNVKFVAKLSRRGQIIFYSGTYSEFQRLVITRLVQMARSNLETMRNRERSISDGEVKLEPLSIRPERDLAKRDLVRLRESLERQYMTVVLYGGNPWLLMSLLDKSDGSTFDLHIYHDEIIIAPVIRVSAASLMRLFATLEEVLTTNILQLPS